MDRTRYGTSVFWRAFGLVVVLSMCAVPAQSGTFTVTKTADTADGTCNADCSLREAIIAANDAPGSDTVLVPAGTYQLAIAGKDEDASVTGDLDITDDLIIQGAGASETIIDGAMRDRVFDIPVPLFAELADLTIQNGKADLGAGIRNNAPNGVPPAKLTITNAVITNNHARSDGGGVLNEADLVVDITNSEVVGNSAAGSGGGIHNIGPLNITNSTIANNSAAAGGGIGQESLGPEELGILHLTNSAVVNNYASHEGGGIFNGIGTDAFITNSTLANNSAGTRGGAVFGEPGGTIILELLNTTIAHNEAGSSGGGLFLTNGFAGEQLKNTIVAENTAPVAPDCGVSESLPSVSAGNNLIGDPTGCDILLSGTDLTGDAGLGSFADDGTPGNGHFPLLSTSQAIDAGNDDECPATDQLGNPRTDGNGDGSVVCDMGAVEFQNVIAPVGGSVTGMIPRRIKCQNDTTGQRVSVPLRDDNSWNCEEAGLRVNADDLITQRISGVADGTASVGGAVVGVNARNVRCDNRSTGQRVLIRLKDENAWNCEAAGLRVRAGDRIRQSVKGRASQAIPIGLNLWNKLGSRSEIENSEVGLDGTFNGGRFTAGMFGGAYLAKGLDPFLVTFPAEVAPTPRGTMEFWAKLIDFPASIAVGGAPVFMEVVPPQVVPPGILGARLSVAFNSNDGCGGGGLVGGIGLATDNVCTGFSVTSTGSFGSWTYKDVLGAGEVDDWHHYALVWDEGGVPGFGARRVLLFLDGNPASGRWQDRAAPMFEPIPAGNKLGLIANVASHGRVAIDNLKIWNFAKTDFSDRFEE